jgi:hypothetical protein
VRDIFAEKPSDCFPWILLLDEGFPDENLQQTQRRSQISKKSKEWQVRQLSLVSVYRYLCLMAYRFDPSVLNE